MSILERYSEASLRANAARCGIPGHMHDGLVLYIQHGLQPGSFLVALLSGDFFEACRRADEENFNALQAYARFLYNDVPAGCFGSKENVEGWMEQHGLLRDGRR